MIALYFIFYNFWRVHQTLRMTPAMEAGVADHVDRGNCWFTAMTKAEAEAIIDTELAKYRPLPYEGSATDRAQPATAR
jgi:hypothetical protein